MGLNERVTDPTNNIGAIESAVQNKIKNISKNLSYPIMVQSDNNTYVIVIGWRQPGILLGKDFRIWNAHYGDDQDSPGFYRVIDGDPKFEYPSEYTVSVGDLNGSVSESYHSAVRIGGGDIFIAYKLDNLKSTIIGRLLHPGGSLSHAMEIISLSRMGGDSTTDIAIHGPVLAYNEILDMVYLAFYCGGKVFVTYLSGIQDGAIPFYPIQLVAGGRNFDIGSNVYDGLFKSMKQNGLLVENQSGDEEPDLPEQRVGFITSTYDAGNLYVYYKDSTGVFKARRIYNVGLIGEPILI
jgi:hypothetical protein